jgi:alpha-glucoside transport system substrate-binding protein
MTHRPRIAMLLAGAIAITAASIAATVASPARGASTTLNVLGPWGGADAQSFDAVLKGFELQNPGVTVNYDQASGGVATTLAANTGTKPDLAVLSLPSEQEAMRTLATENVLQPIDFVEPAVDSNYAFTWKQLGAVGNHLYGLFFKATDNSAFWYDAGYFKGLGLTAPTTWAGLQHLAQRVRDYGKKPFAVDMSMLANLFENVYLNQQGNVRYDQLADGQLRWTDPSVQAALKTMRRVLANPASIAGGLPAVGGTYTSSVIDVFGSPVKAAMVAGGSNALPVVASAPNARPLPQFGVFAFPTIGRPSAPRVIGDADAVVMVNDTAASRALIRYLATPQAATIWAGRGGFLSPNRKVNLAAYPNAVTRPLAAAVEGTTVFRFDLPQLQSPGFNTAMANLLEQYVGSAGRLTYVVSRLQALAPAPPAN